MLSIVYRLDESPGRVSPHATPVGNVAPMNYLNESQDLSCIYQLRLGTVHFSQFSLFVILLLLFTHLLTPTCNDWIVVKTKICSRHFLSIDTGYHDMG